jgi:transposase
MAPELDDELWNLIEPLLPRTYRRLRTRYERRADMHGALLSLARSLICLKQLRSPFC